MNVFEEGPLKKMKQGESEGDGAIAQPELKAEDEGDLFRQNTHPELQEGEAFSCNLPIENLDREFGKLHYKSKRLGQQAYDRYGNTLETHRPVFVSKEEKEKMMGRAEKEIEIIAGVAGVVDRLNPFKKREDKNKDRIDS